MIVTVHKAWKEKQNNTGAMMDIFGMADSIRFFKIQQLNHSLTHTVDFVMCLDDFFWYSSCTATAGTN